MGIAVSPQIHPQVAEFIESEQKLWRPLVRELGVKSK